MARKTVWDIVKYYEKLQRITEATERDLEVTRRMLWKVEDNLDADGMLNVIDKLEEELKTIKAKLKEFENAEVEIEVEMDIV